jgi:hypothetical protein
MNKLLIAAASIIGLSSCGVPHVETRIQQVYCVTPEQYKKLVNAEPGYIKSNLTGNAQKDFKLSAEQNVLLRMYADGLLTILGGCMSPAP